MKHIVGKLSLRTHHKYRVLIADMELDGEIPECSRGTECVLVLEREGEKYKICIC